MYRFLLTPRWWGINLFAALAIPFCLFMGSWQLSRFEARVETHQAAQEAHEAQKTRELPTAEVPKGAEGSDGDARSSGDRTTAGRGPGAAVPLEQLLPVDKETSGRLATATGEYDPERQLVIPDRLLDGERGYYVLTPLRTATDEDGGNAGAKVVPVVRGWLPGDPDPARVPTPPGGTVTVTGVLQASEHQDSAGVHASGGLPTGQLGMISAASLVNVLPYDVYDAWITLPEAAAPLKPVPPTQPTGTGLDIKAFQNLGYTAEWFVFAGFVVFMWYRLFRREAEVAHDRALGLAPAEALGGSAGPAAAEDPDPAAKGPDPAAKDPDPDLDPAGSTPATRTPG